MSDHPVPAMMTDYADLAAIEFSGVQLHADAAGREGAPVVIVMLGGAG